jgi:ATP-dependent Lon protease
MQEFSDQMPSDIVRFPMVPIRDVVIFPFTKVAFKIGRPSSVRALEQAMAAIKISFSPRSTTRRRRAAARPNLQCRNSGQNLQAQKQENGQIKSSSKDASAQQRSRRAKPDGMFFALVRRVPSVDESGYRTDGLLQKIHGLVEQLLRVSPDAYTDALHASLRGISAAQIADAMSSHLRVAVEEKQQLAGNFFRAGTPAKIDRHSRSRNRKETARPHGSRARKRRWINRSASIT